MGFKIRRSSKTKIAPVLEEDSDDLAEMLGLTHLDDDSDFGNDIFEEGYEISKSNQKNKIK